MTPKLRFFRSLAISFIAIFLAFYGSACDQRPETKADDIALNLAIIASPSSLSGRPSTALEALNDGHDPANSQDRSRGSFAIWSRTAEPQWVEYGWTQAVSTNAIEVYWAADERRTQPPQSYRLLYWNGAEFVPVNNPSGLGTAVDQFNRTEFDELTTTKLRLEIVASPNSAAGLLEWKVLDSGRSPDFPPLVNAGCDRVVVSGGKTYLTGAIKALHRKDAPPLKFTWSKKSGPGKVRFENARTLVTTATFSVTGDYELQLKAGKDSLTGESTLKVKVEPPPPSTALQPIHTTAYKIDNQLWNHRIKALIVNWIPHCIDKISDPDLPEGGMNNIIDAANKLAGKPHGRHRGYVFSNAWVFNTIEAMSLALMVDPQGDREIVAAQNKMKATLDDWIPKILAAQESDGYFQTAFTLPRERSRDDTPLEHWTRRGDHEGYVAGYFLEAGIAHHLATGGKDARLYGAARRLADCWYANIGPSPKKEWFDGHQVMEMALVRFGRYVNEVEGGTGGEGESEAARARALAPGQKYIELAKFLLDVRRGGTEYDQSHVPVIQQYEALGHAVRASYSYTAMADIAIETGDVDYQSAAKSLWDNIVNKKYYLTGGIGSGETSEGFGPNYSLGNNAYCESCSSCGEIFFQHRLNRLSHEARFADLYEGTLYNALLGSIDLEGKNFYYQNPLETRRRRYDWHVCPCCVSNISRTLLQLPTWMYLKSGDGIFVNLFIGSTVTVEDVAGTTVEMIQKTGYPWSGLVTLTVNPASPARFGVMIRVPDRDVSSLYPSRPNADGLVSIAVNGSPLRREIENGYAVISREWKAGDRIDLELSMTIQRVKADQRITGNAGRTALRYGPLIYCVERVDQDIDQILDPEAPLTAAWRDDFLGGVVVITGNWSGGSPFTAIPYYARANREPVEKEAAAAPSRDQRRLPPLGSIVWIKDE